MSRWCVLLMAIALCSAVASAPVPEEAVSKAAPIEDLQEDPPADLATARTLHHHHKKFGKFPAYGAPIYGYPLGLGYPLYGGFGYPSFGFGGLYGGFGYPLSYGYGLGGLPLYGGGLF